MSMIGRNLILLLTLIAFAGTQRCQSFEESDLDAILSSRRTASRTTAPMAVKAAAEDFATQLPAPNETTVTPLSQMRIETQLPSGSAPRDDGSAFFDKRILADDVAKPLRRWAPTEFHWETAGVVHRPLYFEDQPLEVYGASAHPRLQPAVSAVRFFAAIPTFPLRVLQSPRNKHVPSVGLPTQPTR